MNWEPQYFSDSQKDIVNHINRRVISIDNGRIIEMK